MRASISFRSYGVGLKLIVVFLCILLIVVPPDILQIMLCMAFMENRIHNLLSVIAGGLQAACESAWQVVGSNREKWIDSCGIYAGTLST